MATTTANEALLNRLVNDTPTFHPASAKLFGGWLLDPGDVVTVSSDGETYQVPVFQMNFNWKGEVKADIQSTGSEKRPPLSELKRRSYASGRQQEEDKEELKEEVIYRTDITRDDTQIGLLASAVGVLIDENTGLPVIGQDGKFEFDRNNPAALTAQVKVTAEGVRAEVIQARDGQGSLKSALDLKANSATLSAVADINGNVTAASVMAAVDATSGASIVKIGAEHITLDGDTTIAGRLTINGNNELVSQGPISSTSYVKATSLTLSDGTYGAICTAKNMTDLLGSVANAQIVQSGTGYKLQVKYIGDTDWTDAGNFSRATALIGGYDGGSTYWQSGAFKVEASPQGVTKQTSLTVTGHWGDPDTTAGESDTTYYGAIKATIDNDARLYDTGKPFEVNASGIYTKGVNYAKPVTIATPTWSKTGTSADATNNLSISATSTGGGSDSATVTIQMTGGSWSGNTKTVTLTQGALTIGKLPVDASERYNAGGKTAWLYYATSQSGHGSNPQGTLEAGKYITVGYTNASGSQVKNDVATWLVPSGGSADRTVTTTTTTGTTTYSSNTYTVPLNFVYTEGSDSAGSVDIPISISNYASSSSGVGSYTITVAGNSDRTLTPTAAYNAGKAANYSHSASIARRISNIRGESPYSNTTLYRRKTDGTYEAAFTAVAGSYVYTAAVNIGGTVTVHYD